MICNFSCWAYCKQPRWCQVNLHLAHMCTVWLTSNTAHSHWIKAKFLKNVCLPGFDWSQSKYRTSSKCCAVLHNHRTPSHPNCWQGETNSSKMRTDDFQLVNLSPPWMMYFLLWSCLYFIFAQQSDNINSKKKPIWVIYLTSVSCTGAETLIGSARVFFTSLCLPFAYISGTMLLSGTAYFVRTWRHLSLIMAVPGLACIPLWW